MKVLYDSQAFTMQKFGGVSKCFCELIAHLPKDTQWEVGIKESDTLDIVEKMADKVSKLRIFEDDEGKMNLDLKKVDGGILSISQFTLYGDCRKGNRPSFTEAKEPKAANEFYEYFNDLLKAKGFKVEKGIFGAHMEIELLNDGPVTIILDSEK